VDEVVTRLQLRAAHVIFGHTHRAGPLPRDDEAEWLTRTGSRLVNAGSWVYERRFLGDAPRESPYWPGTCVVLDGDRDRDGDGDGDGPEAEPHLQQLLDTVPDDEISRLRPG
jgi:hypothetical protein